MRRAVPMLGAALAAVAAVAVLFATWRHLNVALLLQGNGLGYGLPEVAVAAAAGAAVALCTAAARVRRGALLLVGPVLLTALGAQLLSTQSTQGYDGSYVPLTSVTMTQAYSSQLSLVFDGSPLGDAVLLLLGLLAGAGTVVALRR